MSESTNEESKCLAMFSHEKKLYRMSHLLAELVGLVDSDESFLALGPLLQPPTV